ncbi:MAG: DUF6029 family protein [Bacteroidales bacterium]|nr:DUF6029 family protein [Bacteroidales bacterium]
MKRIILTIAAWTLIGCAAMAQGIAGGHITGSVQVDAQMSHADTNIGAKDVEEKLGLNTRADVLYRNGNFSAGLRFEAYQNPLLGFEPKKLYQGQGIAHYFVDYSTQSLSIRAGHFYEQFGSGMILRAYEDRYLGLDNALFGINITYRPVNGVTLKALTGKQRYYWSYSDGLVRGLDGELNLNSVIKAMSESRLHVTIGAGYVSKYEPDETIYQNPENKLQLPLNVGAASARLDLNYGNWSFQTEYARKGQDPSADNNYIYREGEALMVNAGYSQSGFSAQVQAKRIDNMSYRSVRSQSGQMLYIGYIPAITKQHTYAFLSLYPYATQTTGEMGLQADVIYSIEPSTLLGGRYGTDISLNCAVITGLDTTNVGGIGTYGYTSNWLSTGDLYYSDLSLEVAKKLNKKLKLTTTLAYQVFNPVVEGHPGNLHHNVVAVADMTWRVNKQHRLRFEAEWLGSDSQYEAGAIDRRAGDWLMGLVEWNIGRHWFISASDQYAYNDGNNSNYYNLSVGYNHQATRLTLGYGKQREGMLCIGGVCRQVPATNGLTFSLTTSF